MAFSVRTIEADRHREFNASQPSVSFLQTPAWAKVKSEWRSESVGWFNGSNDPVGAGLVLYRQLPKIKKYLAYLPEGPVIDWAAPDIAEWLRPLADHVRAAGAFGVSIGAPAIARRWSAETIKAAIADERVTRLSEASPTTSITRRPVLVTNCARWDGGRRRMTKALRPANHDSSSSCRSRAVHPRTARRHEPAVAAQHQEGREGKGHRAAWDS